MIIDHLKNFESICDNVYLRKDRKVAGFGVLDESYDIPKVFSHMGFVRVYQLEKNVFSAYGLAFDEHSRPYQDVIDKYHFTKEGMRQNSHDLFSPGHFTGY